MTGARVSAILLLLTGTAALTGCNQDARGPRRVVTVPAADICEGVDSATGVWESTPWAAPNCEAGDPTTSPTCCWLEFPGRTALEIHHTLGYAPRLLQPYLSFQNDGLGAAPGSGDTVRVVEVGPDSVTVSNGTDQTFYLRLVLQ